MIIDNDFITYTAEDEEPNCKLCDNLHSDNHCDCGTFCGPYYNWKNYRRSVPNTHDSIDHHSVLIGGKMRIYE